MEDNNKTILDAGAALAEFEKIVPNGLSVPVAVVPDGYEVKIPNMSQVEQWLMAPLRKKGTFAFADAESFIRYVNEHKNEDTRLFASIEDTGADFYGTLNFHGKEPSFNDHKCAMSLTPTREWKVWTGQNEKTMSQVEFATFLEDNADMFTTPSGASLLELVQTLEGKHNVAVNSAVKLQTGAIKFSYTEEVVLRGVSSNQAGDMEIPQILNVTITPFEGTAPYALKARLRYKIDNRKLTFWYKTIDAHLVVRAVCADLLQNIEKQTAIQPFKL